jgi:hypothetical protein
MVKMDFRVQISSKALHMNDIIIIIPDLLQYCVHVQEY